MIEMAYNNKKGQEEMVGFVVIVVIVSIIILFFLVFSLSSDRESGTSEEARSFLRAALAYTSSCEDNREFLSVSELISFCYNEQRCESEEYSCDVLNDTLKSLLEESWPVAEGSRTRGYKFEAVSGQQTITSVSEGNLTGSIKGSNQIIPEAGTSIRASFTVYG